MSLGLPRRIATLLKADAHGVVEALEERSLLLKQYLREAELEVGRKRARLEALRDDQKRLRECLSTRERDLASTDEDVTLALAGGREDLARFAIRRFLPRRSEVQALRTEIDRRSAEADELARRVEAQQAELERLRTRVRAELARETQDPLDVRCESAVADEEVELELMRRRADTGGAS
jgi:phage shock protein A